MEVGSTFGSIEAWAKQIHPLFYASAIGLLWAFWAKIKAGAARVAKLFMRDLYFSNTDTYILYMKYVQTNHKLRLSIFSDPTIRQDALYYKPQNKDAPILFWSQAMSDVVTIFFWKGIIPIFFRREASRKEVGINAATVSAPFFVPTNRWLRDFQEHLLHQSQQSHYSITDITGNRGFGFRNSGVNPEEDHRTAPKPSLALTSATLYDIPITVSPEDLKPNKDATAIFYLNPALSDVFEDIKYFIGAEKWYQDRHLSYRRGFLFYGPPGTGKTLYVKYCAEKFNLPIFRFDLNSMTNRDFMRSWKEVNSSVPGLKIILCEDFSSIFNGRENITNRDGVDAGVSFDCFLNTIDGVHKTGGVILIVTTNHLAHIDAAMYEKTASGLPSRPGRIDVAIEFPLLDKDGKRFIASSILRGYPGTIEEMVSTTPECTPIQFEELCKIRAHQIAHTLRKVGHGETN